MRSWTLAAIAAASVCAHGAGALGAAAVIPFDVTGIPSMDEFGRPGNRVAVVDLTPWLGLPAGSAVTMTGLGWDVVLFADPHVGMFGGSWFREIAVSFSAVATPNDRVAVVPGPDPFTGTSGPRRYAQPVHDVASLLLPDGRVRIEFYELVDDAPNQADGQWVSGQLSIRAIPAPGGAAVLVAGVGLAGGRRRRRW